MSRKRSPSWCGPQDRAIYHRLTDELVDLYITAEETQNRITWRERRIAALIRRHGRKVCDR